MEGESISGLVCQESETTCLEEDTEFCGLEGADDEHVRVLFDREISYGFQRNQSLVFDSWVKCARLEAITWILKSRATFGFRFQTVYLSMTYFDRFLSGRSIDGERPWAIKLLSVACISLAAKMEEINVPAISEFKIEEYNFETKVIKRMELLVLNTLEWKMMSITPFAFLRHFIVKFRTDSPTQQHMISTSIRFIISIMKEISLVKYKPSVVAAAATFATLNQTLTRNALELKMSSVSYSGFLEIDEVLQCYNLMRKAEAEELVGNSQNRLRSIDVLEDSSGNSSIGNKRKTQSFDLQSDQNYSLPGDKRLR